MHKITNIFWLGTKELRGFLHDYVLLALVIYAFHARTSRLGGRVCQVQLVNALQVAANGLRPEWHGAIHPILTFLPATHGMLISAFTSTQIAALSP